MEAETSVPPSTAPSSGTESKAQEQARLRRERRNAKIQAGGSERLGKITSLSGRPAAAEAEFKKSTPVRQAPSVDPSSHENDGVPDPAEVDISQLRQRQPQNNDEAMEQQAMLLRQMLSGAENAPLGGSGAGQQGQQPGGAPEDDPMIRMMQQMLGGAATGQAGAPGNDGMPPGLAEMFGGIQPPQESAGTQADYIWRIIHAICSVALASYIALTFPFTGSEGGRVQYRGVEGYSAPPVFWMFTTLELVLQSSRYFMDKGKLSTSGILGGLGRMLPDPYGRYIRLLSRYSIIYTTILSDAMIVIFVLGCAVWWQGSAGLRKA